MSRMQLKSMSCLLAKFTSKSWHIFVPFFAYIAYYNHCNRDRLKKDGESFKNVKLINNGLLTLVDYIFWYLPFVSAK